MQERQSANARCMLAHNASVNLAYGLAMPAHNPPTLPPETELRRDALLPVPTQEDVDGFIMLYRERYGVELEPVRAFDILGGLMVFLYLTRRNGNVVPTDAAEEAVHEAGDGRAASVAGA